MSRDVKVDIKKLEQLRDNLEKLNSDLNTFLESCAKELAARLLAEVIQRTPVGEYSGGEYVCKVKKGETPNHTSWKVEGKSGGTLRRAWQTKPIRINGGVYTVEVFNATEYAPYVEYGHRTANHKGWVKGHFMLTISEEEIRQSAPKILENKVKKWLSGAMK